MKNSENGVPLAFHIVKKNGHYYVYSPSLVLKGKFLTKNEAMRYIETHYKHLRYPICLQDQNGIIIGVSHRKQVKRIKAQIQKL